MRGLACKNLHTTSGRCNNHREKFPPIYQSHTRKPPVKMAFVLSGDPTAFYNCGVSMIIAKTSYSENMQKVKWLFLAWFQYILLFMAISCFKLFMLVIMPQLMSGHTSTNAGECPTYSSSTRSDPVPISDCFIWQVTRQSRYPRLVLVPIVIYPLFR